MWAAEEKKWDQQELEEEKWKLEQELQKVVEWSQRSHYQGPGVVVHI
jgi:hypothetical protein